MARVAMASPKHMAQSDDTVTVIRSFKALCRICKIISTLFHTPAKQYFNLACKKYFRMHYRIRKYLHTKIFFMNIF